MSTASFDKFWSESLETDSDVEDLGNAEPPIHVQPVVSKVALEKEVPISTGSDYDGSHYGVANGAEEARMSQGRIPSLTWHLVAVDETKEGLERSGTKT